MASYCWGDRHQPHKILSESETHVTVNADGKSKQLPHPLIQGRIDAGQRVRVLTSGGNWKNGVVLDGDRLRVQFDSGEEREIYNANWMRVIDNKPPVIIKTSSELITSPSNHVEKPEVGPCQFCAAPATLLCDGRIKGGTCDRPLCRNCAKHVGNRFGCNRRKPSLSFADTVDWCPDCVAREQGTKSDHFVAKGESLKEFSSSAASPLEVHPGQKITHRSRWLGKSERSSALVLD